ncbi:gliding motility-associated C-terminal domain-containing protein [Flavobacteriales bacterium]|nr:gliding motility-associated C-terminal domain-containing protein [Flavobacteriales bacterium]
MRIIYPFLLFIFLFNYCNAQYNVIGNAYLENGVDNSFVITPNQSSVKGALWYQNQIDLNDSFELVANINLGCDTITTSGGDGIAFVIHDGGPNQATAPYGGGELGYGSLDPIICISPSLAIQFDTYTDNATDYPSINDPLFDHIGLMKNGSIEHNSGQDLLTVPFGDNAIDVENCDLYSNQQITIRWNAIDTILQLFYCNGIDNIDTLIDIKYDIKNEIFTGNSLTYLGFTGSTGSAKNLHKVAITYFDKEPILKDTVICSNQALEYDLSFLTNYSFEWQDDNGNVLSSQPTFSVTSNTISTYQITITNNCTGFSYSQFFTVTPTDVELVEDLSFHSDIYCQNIENGQVGLSYSNPSPTTMYYLNGNAQSSPIFSGLASGNYWFSVVDEYNCSDSVLIEVISDYQEIDANYTLENQVSLCLDGGLAPYQISYGNTIIEDIDSCTILDICFGNFTILIEDSLMCQDSIVIEIDELQAYIDNSQIVVEQAIYPVYFQWSLNGDILDGENDSIFSSGLCPGSYSCIVQDGIGCTKTYSIIIDPIVSNIDKNIDCNDQEFNSIETNVSGGTAPYNFDWSTGETSSQIYNLNPATYFLSITDNNGCSINDELTIPILTDSCLFNAFSPNGDGINDQWKVNSSFIYPDSDLTIYNRWGKKVFESSSDDFVFKGLNKNGNQLVEGTYFYVVRLKNDEDPIKGTISLFR